jgi:branched-chain amino acid transport system permease protein
LNAVAQTVLNNWSAFTGGSAGLRLPAAADGELCYYIALGFAGFAGFVAWRLRRLPIALALRAARQNEIACHSIGIDAPALRLTVVVLAGAIAGIAGGLFAAAQGYVRPEQFDISTTATLLVLMLLGGTRSQLRLALAAIGVVSVLLTVPAIAEDWLLIFGVALVVSPLLRRWAASSFAAPGSMSSALFAPKARME